MLLAAVAAGAAVYWYRVQTRRGALIVAAALAIVGLVALIDFLEESPREEAVRRMEEMIAAANQYRPAGVLPHLSDRFRYGELTKTTLAASGAWQLAEDHAVRLSPWDFDRGYVERPTVDTIAIGFMVRIDARNMGGRGPGALYVRAPFVRDPDGAWRLQTFSLHSDPLRKANGDEVVIPGTR